MNRYGREGITGRLVIGTGLRHNSRIVPIDDFAPASRFSPYRVLGVIWSGASVRSPPRLDFGLAVVNFVRRGDVT